MGLINIIPWAIILFIIFHVIAWIYRTISRFHNERKALESAIKLKQDMDSAFQNNFLEGRKWLARNIADLSTVLDEAREKSLMYKSRPAYKSAEVVREVKSEKRDLMERLKFLEYQLASYEEYFPFLAEYRELILDERIPLTSLSDNLDLIEHEDPVRRELSKSEWESLPSHERNQRGLERYLARPKSKWEIGRMYERYIGHLYEVDGWSVSFHGAVKGFEDMGRDLICKKRSEIHIVQAKCWSKEKRIHEKHVFQLYGSSFHYRKSNPGITITSVLVSTTSLTEISMEIAKLLGVSIRALPLLKNYPMIKCNIGASGEKIYHLPFDQQYDRIQIGNRDGEVYVAKCEEAERLGFRRAWKYRPSTQ